jgi:hypothetical protein
MANSVPVKTQPTFFAFAISRLIWAFGNVRRRNRSSFLGPKSIADSRAAEALIAVTFQREKLGRVLEWAFRVAEHFAEGRSESAIRLALAGDNAQAFAASEFQTVELPDLDGVLKRAHAEILDFEEWSRGASVMWSELPESRSQLEIQINTRTKRLIRHAVRADVELAGLAARLASI